MTSVAKPIAIVGFVVGLLCSVGVLSGDDSGRVNLLYLLLVFLFIPLFGACLSIFSLKSRKGFNSARFLTAIPLWSKSQQDAIYQIQQQGLDKYWLFMQSQLAAIAYSFATLVVFSVMLLTTDINFVWRSTLLSTDQLHPILEFIALPWWFWDAAQPSLQLLSDTQDSRLTNTYTSPSQYGQWWLFVFAVQLVYGFFLRGLLFIFGASILQSKIAKINNRAEVILPSHLTSEIKPTSLSRSLTSDLPDDYVVGNWAMFNTKLTANMPIAEKQWLEVGPQIEHQTLTKPIVLLVKSWEPPLGELSDFMSNTQGYILPFDYRSNTLIAPSHNHLNEWLRFTNAQPKWQLFQPHNWQQWTNTNE